MRFSKSILNDITTYNLRSSTQTWINNINMFYNIPIIFYSNFYIMYYNMKLVNNKSKFCNTLFDNNYLYYVNKLEDTTSIDMNKHKTINTFNTLTTNTIPVVTSAVNNSKPLTNHSSLLWNLFEIYFLRKERTYTKLKYSRVPQYDIVSGGVAAILAGFLGFLICEKFGVELVDSGDFYIVFMYVVFLCFFLKLLLKIMEADTLVWNFYSYKWIILYYYQLILLLFFNIKLWMMTVWKYFGRY